ncbi:hypothetical protein JOE23_001672 [Amphibacillus cookii]|nr:hypothetical protein [Amphibacillus cookii]
MPDSVNESAISGRRTKTPRLEDSFYVKYSGE